MGDLRADVAFSDLVGKHNSLTFANRVDLPMP
jgi:hypothetical protein